MIARDLFPQLRNGNLTQPYQRRYYVQQRMVELAVAGELDVNEMIEQPDEARILISQVLFDEKLEKKAMFGAEPERSDEPCPRELVEYLVEIESVKKTPLRWKAGHRRLPAGLVTRGSSPSNPPTEPAWVYPCGEGAMRGRVPLKHAWVMLERNGERFNSTSRWKQHLYLYRVVPPVAATAPAGDDGSDDSGGRGRAARRQQHA